MGWFQDLAARGGFLTPAYWGQNRSDMDLRKINSEIQSPPSQFCYMLVSVGAVLPSSRHSDKKQPNQHAAV